MRLLVQHTVELGAKEFGAVAWAKPVASARVVRGDGDGGGGRHKHLDLTGSKLVGLHIQSQLDTFIGPGSWMSALKVGDHVLVFAGRLVGFFEAAHEISEMGNVRLFHIL